MSHESTEREMKDRKGFSHAGRAALHYAIAHHHSAMAHLRSVAAAKSREEDGHESERYKAHRKVEEAHRSLDRIHSGIAKQHVRDMREAIGDRGDHDKIMHHASAEVTWKHGHPDSPHFNLEGAHRDIRTINHEHGRDMTHEEAHPFHDHMQ